jgi:TonB family protein
MHRAILVGTAILFLLAAGWSHSDQERPTRVVSLHYPCLALKSRIQGTVRVQCAIGKDGLCSEVKPISGHPLLLKDALDNLKKWRYSPSAISTQKLRSALVQYRFVIGPASKYVYEPDVVVTFDSPNTVTVVAPPDSRISCRTELDERPID